MANLPEKTHSLKNLILDNQLIIDVIRKEKNRIEKDYDDCDKVREEFLLTMLSKGYIDENYSDFLSASYEEQFTNEEYTYIQNLRDELEPNFNLKIEHLHSVEKKILPYKWTNASVLNNDILTDILNNNQSEKIEQFITAIINYCNRYKKNNFLEQYIIYINNKEKKDKLLDELLNKISPKIESGSLSIFNEKTESLFCRMIDKNIDDSTIDSCSKIIGSYLENNTRILKELLKKANHDSSLKEKIKKINPITKNLSDFNDEPEVQKLLIDEAMFQISKSNLGLILAQINDSENNYGYEYFKQNNNIWEKITHSNAINSFIENILLTDNELHYSQYGIVEILFNEKVTIENTRKIIDRIENESIELAALPKSNDVKFPVSWQNITKDLLNQNKLHFDFNNILYVYKLYPKGLIQFAQKVSHKMEPLINNKSLNFEKLDKYAKDNYLDEFFASILDNQNIDDDLFEKIVNIMIYHQIKIIELTLVSLTLFGNIPTTKAQILVKLIFKNSFFNNETINNFLKIINQCFGDFYQNFNNIKDKCINDWNCKQAWISLLSILLKDKENNNIDFIMKEISLNDFGDVIKEWKKDGKLDASFNVKDLLTSKNLDILIKKFGSSTLLDFLDNYKDSLDYYITNDIKEDIEQKYTSSEDQEPIEIERSNLKILLDIAEIHKIPSRAIFDSKIRLRKLFNPITSILQNDSNIKLDWDTISLTTRDIINSVPSLKVALEIITNHPYYDMNKREALLQIKLPKATLRNDLFILGRYFYENLKRFKIDISKFLSFESNDLLKISSIFPLHPLVCGAVFEGFFDKTCNYKDDYNPILIQLSKYLNPNSKGYEFIRDCLKPFRSHLKSDIASIFNL